MNVPSQRPMLMRAVAATWLVLISAAVVINHVTLSNLAEQSRDKASSTQARHLEERLIELTGQVIELGQQQPTTLPQARYETERQALEQRLAALEQALDERATTNDWLTLQGRIEQLETRPVISQPSSTPPVSRPRTVSPKTVEPPFQVTGIELRAGEHFLSILPTGATTLTHTHLLRPGETRAGWRLDAIEDGIAVFQNGNQTRRLVIPSYREKP